MPRFTSTLLALLGTAATSSLACVIPTEPLSNTITTFFSIRTQNPAIPRVHNYIMNFVANGDDEHLVLRPAGIRTYDSLWLDNGLLRTRNIRAVIDLEYDDRDDTTKMFMTERGFHPSAVFQPVYACDPDTDALQIRLQLVSRETTPRVLGGQIGIREVVGTYEFRYSPPGNTLLGPSFMPVNMIIFQDGPRPGVSSTAATTSSRPPVTTTAVATTTSRPPVTTTPVATTSATTTPALSSTTLSTSTTSRPPVTTTTPSTPGSTPPPQGDYAYVSCYAEPPSGRALTSIFESHGDLTNQKCAAICSAGGYPYFGTEWGRECFCGRTLTAGSAPAPASECDFACIGDATQKCGGSRRLSLYHNSAATGPTHPSSIGNYNLYGCVTDRVSARTLTGGSRLVSSTMTLETCRAHCAAGNFEFFGAEYGVECFCGNSFTAGSAEVDIGQCSMVCPGNSAQFCGNGDRLSVYRRAV